MRSGAHPPPIVGAAGLAGTGRLAGNVDGIPATDAELPDVGSGGPLTVELPLPGWSVTAGIAPVGSVTADEAQVPLQPGPDGTFVLDAPATPGAYRVSLFAQGDGDAAYRFRWSV